MKTYDLIIAGAGVAGCAAAVAAADCGMSVMLIEQFGGPGGVAVEGGCPDIMGLSDNRRQIVGGFADALIRRLDRRGRARLIDQDSGRIRPEPIGDRPLIGTVMSTSLDLRLELAQMLEERGVPIKYHHTEVAGPGQIEFELNFGDLVTMADRSMLLKYVAKNQAKSEGLTATFMPKPIYGEAGNGMHVHMMLRKGGEPVFYDANGYSGLSQTALYFIGGILKHAASLCGLTNPSTNSYKRLIPGYEAPTTIGFATANRSAVIRVPAYAKAPEDKRFELRSIDATCNPYYAYAAILMAGIDGIKNKIDPVASGWGPYDFNLYNLSAEEQKKIHFLPNSLPDALAALEADHDYLTAGGVFPERLIEIWNENKLAEAKAIAAYPHPAEFKYYYDL